MDRRRGAGSAPSRGGQCAFPVGHRSPVRPQPRQRCSSTPGPTRRPAPCSLWLESLTLSLLLQLSPNPFLADSKYSSVPPGVRAETSQLISCVLREQRVHSSGFQPPPSP